MSRRDTIILAVLLNTGLLAVLFVIAINPDGDHFTAPVEIHSTIVEMETPEPVKQSVPVILAHENRTDEVDNVLKDFAATMNVDNVTALSSNRRRRYDDDMIAMHVEEPKSSVSSRRQEKTENTSRYQDDQQYVEVTVKRGDILGRIAQANNTTVSSIKRVNNLSSDNLKIGQVLRVPVGSKKESSKKIASKAQPANDSFTRYYTVQSGDNPWKIAKKFNVSVRELLRLNDLDEAKARNLRPGDNVRVQ
jgi:peptidoglycan DL-endopeptidase LytF